MPEENWKRIPIKGFKHSASDFGRVRNDLTGTVLAPDSSGRVVLASGDRRLKISVKRAVALAWIPNPDGCNAIGRRDGDRANNRPGNLYWYRAKVRADWDKRPQPVLCVETKRVYGSINEAARDVRRSPVCILIALRNGGKSAEFHWRYAEEEKENEDR